MKIIFSFILSVFLLFFPGNDSGAAAAPSEKSAPARSLSTSHDGNSGISRDVENVRLLKFKHPVRTDVQTQAEFRSYITNSIARQFGEQAPEHYVEALVKLGALDRRVDLIATALALLESQAVAHYDPKADVCHLLATNAQPTMLDCILSHELCHALQDQHYDLHAFLEKDTAAIRDNGDSTLAKQCLVEGEAMYVMTAWMIMRQMNIKDAQQAAPMISGALGLQASLDFETVMKLAEEGGNSDDFGLTGMGKAMEELKNHPRFFVETLYGAYIQGAAMVDRIKAEKGWEGISELYRRPPRSTEQVLHPEKLLGESDPPLDVRIPEIAAGLPDGWRLMEEDVLGEMGIRILLDLYESNGDHDSGDAESAAMGWGGDRYYYCENEDTGGHLLVWKTIWDSERDADEFAVAYRVALRQRFPALSRVKRSASDSRIAWQTWEVSPGRFLKLAARGAFVGIIDTTDQTMLDFLME